VVGFFWTKPRITKDGGAILLPVAALRNLNVITERRKKKLYEIRYILSMGSLLLLRFWVAGGLVSVCIDVIAFLRPSCCSFLASMLFLM
jgi:hypothetical protein